MTTNTVITLSKYNELIKIIIQKIDNDKTFHPDTIIALSTGGFPVAASIAKRLGISSRHVVGIPVYKDAINDYHLDEELIKLGNCSNRQILIVDEASKRGLLTQKAVQAVKDRGGIAKSCVFIAWEKGIQPDYVAEICPDDPPDFFWE